MFQSFDQTMFFDSKIFGNQMGFFLLRYFLLHHDYLRYFYMIRLKGMEKSDTKQNAKSTPQNIIVGSKKSYFERIILKLENLINKAP
jgi:hypothetical protein